MKYLYKKTDKILIYNYINKNNFIEIAKIVLGGPLVHLDFC